MECSDWRTQLQQDSRERIVNDIMEMLKRHFSFSTQEGLLEELKKIAIRFEEMIYAAATSQSDYMRKISSKMLVMELKSKNPKAVSLQSNAAATSRNKRKIQELASSECFSGQSPSPSPSPRFNHPSVLFRSGHPRPIAPAGDTEYSDWRTQLHQDTRDRNVNEISLPFAAEEELKKVAIKFEERTYSAATSQSDYRRKIYLKMLAMQLKPRNSRENSLQSNAAATGQNPQGSRSQQGCPPPLSASNEGKKLDANIEH